MKRVSNFKKSVFMRRVVWVARILKTISNIKVTSHDKDVVDIDFSILEILQSQLRIHVNKKVNANAIEKRNT